MSWIGRKKLALVPLYVPDADPPVQLPADWENQIVRRVLFDPDATTGADRSLRAYIHAASSGRADFDAVLMPLQTVGLDGIFLPTSIVQDRFNQSLRAQGFDAAAIVVIGFSGGGGAEVGGFWVHFETGSNIGLWAQDLIICLTGFFAERAGMGAFDGIINPFASGTHPSAYTKAAIGWLDASTIAVHTGGIEGYNLHSVGLVQPSPSGRFAAVRIGSHVPYLMVEARQRVDQFDAGVSSEGVIVYRIQTSDPLGHDQNDTAPLQLLTAIALTPGQAFTSDTHVSVQVINALPGGFSIHVHDPKSTVPDVVEMSASIAAKEVNAVGLVPKFTGPHQPNSWVSSQTPPAGDVVSRGSTVTMALRTGPLP